ncbi:hypothetical protein ATY78_10040 [Rhizobium sp. R635]|nr:hypothetical protein ATY78_10040 [Rhizobium sp. R635]
MVTKFKPDTSGLVPRIYCPIQRRQMLGTRPSMTKEGVAIFSRSESRGQQLRSFLISAPPSSRVKRSENRLILESKIPDNKDL